MAGIVGSPYIDSYLYSQNLPFLNSSFHHDLFLMSSWDWKLVEIRYRLLIICHELQAFEICRGRELLVPDSAAWLRLMFRLYLFELSEWKPVHNLYYDTVFGSPNM